jgi:hypothetical protein
MQIPGAEDTLLRCNEQCIEGNSTGLSRWMWVRMVSEWNGMHGTMNSKTAYFM